jgi:uncharacterized protein YndB with AHSA1/START domain
VEVEVRIDAPPSAVWPVVRDITTPTRFSEELQEARWLEEGTRFAGRNRHAAIGEWETTCVVTADDPERVFEWAVGDADAPSASWRFTLEPDGDGTVLRQWMRIGPARSGLTPAIEAMPDKEERIIARRLEEHRANMQRTVDGIRALVEAPPEEI